MYPIIEVPSNASDLPEQLGTKRKFWFADEGGHIRLFKEGRPNTGENWAEKVACEIAQTLGIPCAHYELAIWGERKGVVSPKFVPDDARLVLGNEILGSMVKGYVATGFRAKEHKLHLVLHVLTRSWIGLPLSYPAVHPITTGSRVFIGYLMLDALIGNQDRHHQNWGLIVSPGKQISLAPTFDHGSSLGRNETDANRQRRLTTRDTNGDINAYCARATSAFYPTGATDRDRPLTTLAAFQEGSHLDRAASAYWLTRLAQTTVGDFEFILRQIPEALISEPAVEFALRMLEINRNRLLTA